MQYIHYCNNSGIGIADFQGWSVKGEKAEREKGCCVCTGDYRIQRKSEYAGYRYCPNCGRKLRKDGDKE